MFEEAVDARIFSRLMKEECWKKVFPGHLLELAFFLFFRRDKWRDGILKGGG